MHEFAIFPDLSLRLRNFDKSMSRFFELASNYIQEERDLLLSSQLLTYVLQGVIISVVKFSDLVHFIYWSYWIHWSSSYCKLSLVCISFLFYFISIGTKLELSGYTIWVVNSKLVVRNNLIHCTTAKVFKNVEIFSKESEIFSVKEHLICSLISLIDLDILIFLKWMVSWTRKCV